ncbi:MAG TPA: O-antigen ligase family protein [Ignavibacteriaceae bacterium]|nr:O-antigen ligase family protein [Ignavibacteriaceae bacterium]
MIKKNHLNISNYEVLSILILIAISLVSYEIKYILMTLPFILIVFFRYYFQLTDIIIILLIIGLIALTTEFYEQFRPVLTLISYGILFFFFLRKYGLEFSLYPRLPRALNYFFLLLFIALFISTVFSGNKIISSIALLRTIGFFLLCYLFYSLIENQNTYFLIIYALIAVVAILGYRMILDFITLGPQFYFARVIISEAFQLSGSLGYTGLTIFFISLTLLAGMFFMNRFSNKTKYFIITPVLILNILIIILANSRGGILAALFSIIFIILILDKRALYLGLVTSTISLLIFYLTISSFQGAIDGYLRFNTVSDREIYWQMGLDVIQDNPLTGVGVDMFDKQFYNYASSDHLALFKTGSNKLGKPHPHNFFLYYTAENGILGFFASIGFFLVFFYLGIKTIQLARVRERDKYVLSIVIVGIGIGLFVRTFIEIAGLLTYGYITRDLPFWLLFVILIKIYMELSTEKFPIKE